MALSVSLLLVSALAIYLACEYFVNGVEWVGRKADIAEKAVGTILAAFGTAMPESIVTFVAVVLSGKTGKDIGVGAALGGPLVLSTIAYAVVGVMLLARGGRAARPAPLVDADGRLSRDQGWFLLIFAAKAALGLFAFALKPWLGWLFLLAYALYFHAEMRRKPDAGQRAELEPLKLRPRLADPGLTWAVAQTLIALVVIFAASHAFVVQLERIGPWLGLPPAVTALLLSPIATELPETVNAIIWVRQGKTDLALANISGSMMIQATIPSALGIFFTPWLFDDALILSAGITMVSIGGMFLLLRNKALTPLRLALFGLFYFVFALALAAIRR